MKSHAYAIMISFAVAGTWGSCWIFPVGFFGYGWPI